MKNIESLLKKPRLFRMLTGVSPEVFQGILKDLRPLWKEARQKRLYRKNRQRRIGAGLKFSLSLQSRLLCLLMYYRTYVSQGFLGILFNVDDSTVSRNIRLIQPLLAGIFRIPERKVKMTKDEVWQLWIDGTEQKIEKPKKKNGKWYSGKKKSHTIQHQIIINDKGKIKAIGKA